MRRRSLLRYSYNSKFKSYVLQPHQQFITVAVLGDEVLCYDQPRPPYGVGIDLRSRATLLAANCCLRSSVFVITPI